MAMHVIILGISFQASRTYMQAVLHINVDLIVHIPFIVRSIRNPLLRIYDRCPSHTWPHGKYPIDYIYTA